MAQRVTVTLEDDLTGGKADETVTFALDGKDYEIDLSRKNGNALRKALEPFLGAARRSTARGKQSRGGRRTSVGSDTTAIRAWAKAHGMEVSERGRISAEVRQAFEAAQPA